MIREHDRIMLTVALPIKGLVAGDVGTVLHIYSDRNAYEVEFTTLAGTSLAVVTLEADKIRRVSNREISHGRDLAAALTAKK
jgi:hypothetical protein